VAALLGSRHDVDLRAAGRDLMDAVLREAHLAPTTLRPRSGTRRVVVADRHELVGIGVAGLLRAHPPFEVHAVEGPPRTLPVGADVVLVDPDQLLDEGGLRSVVEVCGSIPCVAFSHRDDERSLFAALRAGVRGYALKSTTAQDLVDVLDAVARGRVAVDPALASRALLVAAHQDTGRLWVGVGRELTERESQVLLLLVEGCTNREVAEALHLGEETVRTHLRSLYRKLGVRDRAEAVAHAFRTGLVR
jgi:DNA-binding NarL/FixJ family response regulator